MKGSPFDYADAPSQEVLPLGIAEPKPDPTLGEALSAGYQSARAGPDWGLNQSRYESSIMQEFRDAMIARGHDVGPIPDLNQIRLQQRREERGERPPGLAADWAARDRTFWAAVADERKRDPAFMSKYGDVRDLVTLRDRAIGSRQHDLGEAETVLARTGTAGTVAGFLGMIGGSYDDPLNYIPIGGGATKSYTMGRALLSAALREGAVNAGVQLATEPLVRQDAKRLGIDRDLGDTFNDTAVAFGFGAALGGTFELGHQVAPSVRDGLATLREKALAGIFDKVPERVQRRWIEAGTIGDRADLAAAREAIGADRLTPQERDAFHVVETTAEIRETSPFAATPAGDMTHGQRLAAAIDAMLADRPVPDFPPIARGRAGFTGATSLSGSADVAGKIILAESGGKATARNEMPGQSASGLGQFTDSTWLSGIKQWFPEVARGKSREQLLALKTDPLLGRQMTERAVQEHKRVLGNAGLPTSDGNVYLMHFLGPRGVELLRADPERAIKGLLPDSWIAANPTVLKGKTVGDVIAWADGKMGSARPEPVADTVAVRPELFEEPGIDPEAAIDDGFDPTAHRDRAESYVRGKGSLRLDRFAKAMDLPLDQANRVLGMLARIDGSGLTISRKGVVRRRPVLQGPLDLLTQIADWGGLNDAINPDTGRPRDDLANGMGLARRMTKAGPVLNKNGLSIDELGERLQEAGWFQDRPDAAQVLDLIDEAARGKKLYRPDEMADGQARDRDLTVDFDDEKAAAIDNAAQGAGIELDSDIRARAVAYLDETGDADEALHRAMMDAFDETMGGLAFEADDGYYDRIGDGLSDEDWARIEELGNGRQPEIDGPGVPAAGDRGAVEGEPGGSGERGDAGPGGASAGPDDGARRASDPESRRDQDDALIAAGEAARFDDPYGDAAGLQAENIEHDLRMELAEPVDPAIAERQRQQAALKAASPMRAKAEQDGTMGLGLFDAAEQPEFRLDEGGSDHKAGDLLDGLDRDLDAWDAIEKCQTPPKTEGA